ncbi:MAG: restriction endonuclease [Sulfurovaceae bacterium]|nr:restriction endonuclease [Sulfurovaceae bacterium]MDD5549374.1 restriction endonuclease [Sulfurovaceae bacterium]
MEDIFGGSMKTIIGLLPLAILFIVVKKHNAKNKKKQSQINSNLITTKKQPMAKNIFETDKPKIVDENSHIDINDIPHAQVNNQEEFEEHVKHFYEYYGYSVHVTSIIGDQKANGIDLIAKKDKTIIFIYCKYQNEESQKLVTKEDAINFENEVENYLNKNALFKSSLYHKKMKFVTSGDFLESSAAEYIKSKTNMDLEILNIK